MKRAVCLLAVSFAAIGSAHAQAPAVRVSDPTSHGGLVLGMTLFLLFPFTRLVHVWSGFALLAYPFRARQVVRSRRLNLPVAGLPQPQAGAGAEARSRRPVAVADHSQRLPGAAD